MPTFGTNNVLFGYLWSRNLKKLLSCFKSWHLKLSICKVLWKKKKMPKLVTRNACFGKFLSLNLETMLSYLMPSPLNLSNCKIYTQTKMPKLGTENALFGYFSSRSSKHYCLIWNQHPQLCLIAKFR